MSALDQIKAHFSRQELRRIEVPEWGTEEGGPLVIFSKPMTLEEKQRLLNVGEREGRLMMLVETLVMKALNADGSRMFQIDAKKELKISADPDVLARVALEITRSLSPEELEKK